VARVDPEAHAQERQQPSKRNEQERAGRSSSDTVGKRSLIRGSSARIGVRLFGRLCAQEEVAVHSEPWSTTQSTASPTTRTHLP